MDDQILRTLRMQAWERAKGELHSLLSSFWSQTDEERDQYNELHNLVKAFISKIEEEGYAE